MNEWVEFARFLGLLFAQGAAVILVAWMAARLRFRWHPAGRHAIWLGTLLTLAFLPLGNVCGQWFRLGLWKTEPSNASAEVRETRIRPRAPEHALATQPVLAMPELVAAPDTSKELHAERPGWTADLARHALLALLLVWGMGAIWQSVRLAVGLRRSFHLRRRAITWNEAVAQDALKGGMAALRAAGLEGRSPELAIVPDLKVPISVGPWAPMILLPAKRAPHLSVQQLRDVVVHEAAHILRGDHLAGLLQRAAGIVYWPLPLFGVLHRELSRAREECCDNYVLRVSRRTQYARVLLDVGEGLTFTPDLAGAEAMACPEWKLERRIEELLDERRNTMSRMSPLGRLAVVFCFVSLLAGFVVCRAEEEPAPVAPPMPPVPETPDEKPGLSAGISSAVPPESLRGLTWHAQEQKLDEEHGLLQLTGKAWLVINDIRCEADRIELNRKTRTVNLKGHVRVVQKGAVLECDEMQVKMDAGEPVSLPGGTKVVRSIYIGKEGVELTATGEAYTKIFTPKAPSLRRHAGLGAAGEKFDWRPGPLSATIKAASEIVSSTQAAGILKKIAARDNLEEHDQFNVAHAAIEGIVSSSGQADVLVVLAKNPNLTQAALDYIATVSGAIVSSSEQEKVLEAILSRPNQPVEKRPVP